MSKLEPARFAVGSQGRNLRIERYWDLDFSPNERATEADLVEELRERLAEAVTLHQISDVPVGAFLSGGLDSSAVVAMMSRPRDVDLKTFSIGFAEATHDELPYAREVAAKFGTDHYDLVLRPNVVQIVEDLTWYLDEPFGDTSAIPTYMVSKLAAEHVKVVLSGDGGDELFAGYDKYVVEGRERVREQIPRALRKAAGAVGAMMPLGMTGRRFLRHLALEGPDRYFDASTMFHADEMRRLFRSEALVQIARHDAWATARAEWREPDGDWLAAAQYDDINRYLPLDILAKVDRMTMAHSIEARPPLLDHKFVEFAATIPARFRLQGGDTKAEARVRGAARPLVPERPRRLRAGRPAVADVPRARHLRHPRRGASVPAARARPRSRPAALDDAVVRVVVPAVPGYDGGARRRPRADAADAPEAGAAGHRRGAGTGSSRFVVLASPFVFMFGSAFEVRNLNHGARTLNPRTQN